MLLIDVSQMTVPEISFSYEERHMLSNKGSRLFTGAKQDQGYFAPQFLLKVVS